MKVVLAGGNGFLGRHIAADLSARGHETVILTRAPQRQSPYRQVAWDGTSLGPWVHELAGAALVNLAGEHVDRRPTPANIDLLTRSRVEPTRALARAAEYAPRSPAIWVQMSTLAIYGDGGEAVLDERALPAQEPPEMVDVARAWEAAAAPAPGLQQVILRAGLVLDTAAPLLSKLVRLVRCGVGGRFGDGRQWVSWLHIADYVAMIRMLVETQRLAGVVHATSPNPVRNTEFMTALRTAWHRPPAPPIPAWLARTGSILLRSDPAPMLTGRRCIPGRLAEDDFTFRYPHLDSAVANLFTSRSGVIRGVSV